MKARKSWIEAARGRNKVEIRTTRLKKDLNDQAHLQYLEKQEVWVQQTLLHREAERVDLWPTFWLFTHQWLPSFSTDLTIKKKSVMTHQSWVISVPHPSLLLQPRDKTTVVHAERKAWAQRWPGRGDHSSGLFWAPYPDRRHHTSCTTSDVSCLAPLVKGSGWL